MKPTKQPVSIPAAKYPTVTAKELVLGDWWEHLKRLVEHRD